MIRLTRREKIYAVALSVLIATWLLYAFAVKPTAERIKTLNRIIPEKQQELRKLRAKSNEYIFLRDSLAELHAKVASQQSNFELLPFLESVIDQSGLNTKVATMTQQVYPLEPDYTETIVEIELENLTLRQLVDFLIKVESSDVLAKTKTLYIKVDPTNKDLIDSVVRIHNAKLAQNRIARH